MEQMERMLRRNAENQIISSKLAADEALKESRLASQARMLAIMNADSAIKAGNETLRLRMISVARSMSLRSQQSGMTGDLQALLALQAFLFNRKNNGSRNDADIYMGLYTLAKQRNSDKIKIFEGLSGAVNNILFIPVRNAFLTSDKEGRVLMYDMNNPGMEQNYRLLYTDSEIVDVMAVSPKADWLACGDGSNSVKMISLNGSGANYELKGHSGKIKSLVFSYDGGFLYSAAVDGKVLKWNLASGNSVEIETDRTVITSLDVSSDNKYIAGITDQGSGVVWNSGNSEGKLRIEAADKRIRCIRFKPDEARIAVGYDNGIIEIWDVSEGKKISEFQAHSGEIKEIRFNRSDAQMATSGEDQTLKLWDTGDFISAPVCFNDNDGIVIGFDFSPKGDVILSGSIGSRPRIFARPAYADSFAADGCSYVTRNFTPNEWLAYVGRDITYEKTCPEAEFRIKIREIR
jgi:WD40 repeat protein